MHTVLWYEVINAKDDTESTTLSMAYARAEFATKVIEALAAPESRVTLTRKEIGKELDCSANV